MNHPDIERTMRRGYVEEPIQFSKCVKCTSEIYIGDEYIEHAGNHFCDDACLLNAMLEEGNAERKVAGDDTVRIV